MPLARDVPDDDEQLIDMGIIMRLAGWGLGAAGAVIIAVFAGNSPQGAPRVAYALNALSGTTASETQTAMAAHAATQDFEADADAFRLKEGMRVLAADRDRLAARLASVEHNLDDITGSISRQAKATGPDRDVPHPAGFQAVATRSADAAETAVAGGSRVGNGDIANAWSVASAQDGAGKDAVQERTGDGRIVFGVEIGTARTLTAVRALWSVARKRHGPLFANMRPVVAIHESKPGITDLRLVVGPLENADASARLCASLAIARQHCQTAIFEGQRLVQQ